MESNKRMASGDNPRSVEETHHQPLSDNRNPLLNDVVLTRLFEFCQASDIPLFRLVSKKWRAATSDRFRRDVQVKFQCRPSSSGRLEAFFELMMDLDPGEVPFGNFQMKQMDIGLLPVDSETPIPVEFLTFRQNVEQFWGRYGSCIRKLELCNPVVNGVAALKKLILEETPNLEELSLVDIIETQDKTGNTSSSSTVDGENIKMHRNMKRLVVNPLHCLPLLGEWDLLRHFPNLQNVDVTPGPLYNFLMNTGDGSITEHLTKMSEQLTTTRSPCRITVHGLKFSLRSQAHATISKTLFQIPQLSLPKLNLSLEFSDRDCEVDVLSTAFRHQGENIEYLYLQSHSWPRKSPYDNFPFKLGPFNSMTSIHLEGNLCKNLHFLQNFPNLEILEMGGFSVDILEKTESTIMETFTLLALKDFRFNMRYGHITKDKMEMLVKVMPSVETFHGRLTNESFRVLCREWKELKVLFILSSRQFHLRISDEGITGIICGSEERLPNITDLKALESFSYKGKDLSDASIWNGFLQMPNLKNLSVRISTDASEDAFRALREKITGGNINRRTSSDTEDSS